MGICLSTPKNVVKEPQQVTKYRRPPKKSLGLIKN